MMALIPKKIELRLVVIPCLLLLFTIISFERQFESRFLSENAPLLILPIGQGERLLVRGWPNDGPDQIVTHRSSIDSVSSGNSQEILATGRTTNCSCEDDLNSPYCCQRAIIGVYNMGLSAVDEVITQFDLRQVASPEIMSKHQFGELFEAAFNSPVLDYRHVVVTHNWYDTIVSGYVCHKNGAHCWLDWLGREKHRGWLVNNTSENWEQRLLNVTHRWWPPGKGRDFGSYLNEESEDVGLRVYAAWTMACFLDPLLAFRRSRLARETEPGQRNRTVFLCYEKLLALDTSAATRLYLWLFPNRTLYAKVRPPQYQTGRPMELDPIVRNRLLDLIAKIDEDSYNGSIAAGNAELGCQPFPTLES